MAATAMTPLWQQTSREKIATCIARMDQMRNSFPGDYWCRPDYAINLYSLEAACRMLIEEPDGRKGTAAAGAVAATVQG